jgi:hypothetical protein
MTQNTRKKACQQAICLTMAEFNLDISVVLQDAAMAVSRVALTQEGDGVSVPRAASNASQQISVLNSITTMRAPNEEIEDAMAIDQLPQPSAGQPPAMQPPAQLPMQPPVQTPAQPMQTPLNAWATPLITTAMNNSVVLQNTTTTTITRPSVDSSNTQTTTQEDSSLTASTEHVGMSEPQIQHLLAEAEKKWQAKMQAELDLRMADQPRVERKQPKSRKTRRQRTRVQTAQSNGGGPLP